MHGVQSRRNKTKFCFKTFLNSCSINILNNAKWVKGISIHIFIKNKIFIRCVMILKGCFNIVVGFGN